MAVEAPDIGVPLQCGAKRKVNAAVGRETCAGAGEYPRIPFARGSCRSVRWGPFEEARRGAEDCELMVAGVSLTWFLDRCGSAVRRCVCFT